ncbi:MAG: DUF4358 domain-containing protein [Negativibacillus sp.]|nr:DUF4358 domain-containing protein [Negativibacillus sp.]
MKKITGLTLTVMLIGAMLTGCAEQGRVGRVENRAGSAVQRAAEEGKQAADRAGKAAKDTAKDGARAAQDLMEQEQGMLMAAGSRIQDVIMELGEALGIAVPQKLDETSLQEVFGLDPADIEEYYGEYSAVNTSADHMIGVKVKDGKVDKVRQALENRKNEVIKNFQEYLPDQYDKAQAGRIIEKGNYLFLVIAGDSAQGYDSEMDRAEKIVDRYFD